MSWSQSPGPAVAALMTNQHGPALNAAAAAQQAQYNKHLTQQAMANNAYAQNRAAAQHQQMISGLGRTITNRRYMIDGVPMDFKEFVDTIYPEDCAEKTHLILKFKKEE